MNARLPLYLRCLPVLLFLAVPTLAQASTLSIPSAAYPTIQSGINAAHDGDTVLVADGTYTGDGNRDIDFNGKNITVTSQHGAAKTIINCGGYASTDGSGNHRGFYIHSGEIRATISGFTVKNGYESGYGGGGGIYTFNISNGIIILAKCNITGNTAEYGGGGGAYNGNSGSGTIVMADCTVTKNASLDTGGGIENSNFNDYNAHGDTITLINCAVAGNTAHSDGGGIHNANNGGTITLVSCTANNNVTQSNGGGIGNFNYHYRNTDSGTVTLMGCTATGNSSQVEGGGVYNSNDGGNTVTLTNCSAINNTAAVGGGIYNGNAGSTTLEKCTVTGNTAFIGGGIQNSNTGVLVLNSCTVTGNTVEYNGSGGGIYNGDSGEGTIDITNCVVTGNTAQYGGGVYNGMISGVITCTNCTIIGNISQYGGGGGGLYNANGGGTIDVINCAITKNTANTGVGGGIYNYSYNSTTTVVNCTVTGNTANLGGGIFINANNATTFDNSIIALTNCTITGNTSTDGSGGGIFYYEGDVIVTLTNDIIYADTGGEVSISGQQGFSPTLDFCDVQGDYSGYGIGNINADPLFVNAAAGDFRLKLGSPCLGAGTASGAPITDKVGTLRPNPPSIGAYELTTSPAAFTYFTLSPNQIDAPGQGVFPFLIASGYFSKVTVSPANGSLSIVSPTFTLTNFGGLYWTGAFPTAFLKLAKTNPVTFIATGTRADGSTATLTTTLQINNRPTLTLGLYPDRTVIHRNETFNLFGFAADFTGLPALYTNVQITLPSGIDYVSSDGLTYNPATRTLTKGVASLNFYSFNLVLRAGSTVTPQTTLTLSGIASCPGFQQAVQTQAFSVAASYPN